jgi:phage shock protein PspC (stress-responsive transcriptional regulator)
MCRRSTFGYSATISSQGSHALRPEDHPDQASNLAVGRELMAQSRSNPKVLTVQEGQFDMTLYRPRDDRIIAGVCSGIARRFNLDPTIVRILFVASLFLPGPQLLIYLVAWLLMPDESSIVA